MPGVFGRLEASLHNRVIVDFARQANRRRVIPDVDVGVTVLDGLVGERDAVVRQPQESLPFQELGLELLELDPVRLRRKCPLCTQLTSILVPHHRKPDVKLLRHRQLLKPIVRGLGLHWEQTQKK